MKNTSLFSSMTILAATAMLVARPTLAAEAQRPVPAAIPRAHDVATTPQGAFQGRVVNADGRPVGFTEVHVLQGGHPIARTTTDTDGNFAVAGLAGGVYQVAAGGTVVPCRVWTSATAPPVAGSAILVVARGNVVRGQGCCGPECGDACGGAGCDPCGDPCGNACGPGPRCIQPLLIGGLVVAAAIAIPLAITNDDDNSGS